VTPHRQPPGDDRGPRLADARRQLLDRVDPHDRVARVQLSRSVGRVVAEPLTAAARVPDHDRVVTDGYAVRAAATTDASAACPVTLELHRPPDDGSSPFADAAPAEATSSESDGSTDGPDRSEAVVDRIAVPVDAGDPVPPGADAIVPLTAVERPDQSADSSSEGETDPAGGRSAPDRIALTAPVSADDGVLRAGGDVVAGQTLFDPGHRLRSSDVGLLKAAGVGRVPVAERPSVGIVPTGDELVEGRPGPGEAVETDGQVLSGLVDRWGGVPTYRNVVPDDDAALAAALTRETASDVIAFVGGSGRGQRDLVVDAVADQGEVLTHGVAMAPGGSVALGVVRDRPVLVLPGAPVACTVTAVQFLRPVVRRVTGQPVPVATDAPTGDEAASGTPGPAVPTHPTVRARLDEPLASESGTRTFSRVRLRRRDGSEATASQLGAEPASSEPRPDTEPRSSDWVAVPTRSAGGTLRSTIALADGWVVVPESRSRYDAGETVSVERWEWSP
jgi:molybdopterin molybdotransferase